VAHEQYACLSHLLLSASRDYNKLLRDVLMRHGALTLV
jgi:hypothetical protein